MRIWHFIVCFLYGLSMYGQNTDTISNLNPFNRLEIKTGMMQYEYTEKRNGFELKRHEVSFYPRIDGIFYEEGFNSILAKKYLYSCPQAYNKVMDAINANQVAKKASKKHMLIGLGAMATGFGIGAYLLSKDKLSGAGVFGAGFLGGGIVMFIGRFKSQSILNKAPSSIDIVNEYNKFCYIRSIDTTALAPVIDSTSTKSDTTVAQVNKDMLPKETTVLPLGYGEANIVMPTVEIQDKELAQNSIKNLNKTSFFGVAITPLDMTIASRIFAMSMTVEPFYSRKGYELLFSYSNRIGRDSLSKNHKVSFNSSIPLFSIGTEGKEDLELDGTFDGMSMDVTKKLKKLKKVNLDLGIDYMNQRIENSADDGNYSVMTASGVELNDPILKMKSTNVRIGLSRFDFISYNLKTTFNKKEGKARNTYVMKYYLDFLYNLNADYTYKDQPLAPLDFNKYGLVGGIKYYSVKSIGGYYFNLELGRMPRPTIFNYDYFLMKLGFTLGGAKRK